MRDYAKISTTIWRSQKFRALKGDDAKLLYFYLHTCPAVNSVGCFVLPEGYACTDLQWVSIRYQDSLETLAEQSLIGFDTEEEVIRIVDYVKRDPFANSKHALGAVRIASKLPDCLEKFNLFSGLISEKFVAGTASESIAAGILETLSIRYQNPIEPPLPLSHLPNPRREVVEERTQARNELDDLMPTPAPSSEADDLLDRAIKAAGRDRANLTSYWMPPAATVHVWRWVTDLGLSPDQVIDVIRGAMGRFTTLPNGPKAFDHAMKSFAGALAAPRMQPDQPKGPTNDHRQRRIAFDTALNAAADLVDQHGIGLDDRSRDPFAILGRADPEEG